MNAEISLDILTQLNLPIVPHVKDIALTLAKNKIVVLTAETGAGKSTVVPIAVQAICGGSVIMLEPRRAATVAAAYRIAELLDEKPGQRVGYAVRRDSKLSDATRITVLTEALLSRRMMNDPFLDGVSVVILDEFHERSIHADTALAFLLELRELRPDLCILIMSATVDAQKIATFLSAPVYTVPGRCFPVTVSYHPITATTNAARYREWAFVCATSFCDSKNNGSVLMFLPGIKELQNVARELTEQGINPNDIQILHGSLPIQEQQAILKPRIGARIILSSAVAETSVTVPDVTLVIDAGLSRISRFAPQVGMNRLVTEQVTHASAQQRSGRAGRTGPGKCIRLWSEHDRLIPDTIPEILRSDLTSLVLQCAQRGVTSWQSLTWLDPPPDGAWNHARDLLTLLGALTPKGDITQKGLCLLQMPCDIRVGASALVDRDSGARASSFLDAALRLGRSENANICACNISFDSETEHDIKRSLLSWHDFPSQKIPYHVVLSAGFVDRLAKKNNDNTYTLYSGRIAKIAAKECDLLPEYLTCIDADAGTDCVFIYLYVPLTQDEANILMSNAITTKTILSVDDKTGSFKMRRRRMYGEIILDDTPAPCTQQTLAEAYIQYVIKNGISVLPWTNESQALRARLLFYAHHQKDAVDFSDQTLLQTCEQWLTPYLTANQKEPCSAQNLFDALSAYAGYQHIAEINKTVPEYITVPSGSKIKIDYQNPDQPVLAVKVQEMFGCTQTPQVLGVPILLHLLSPSRRPLQITADLAHFWQTTWHDVVKDMRGKYPKHPWPDNPFEVPPTAKTKRQLEHSK